MINAAGRKPAAFSFEIRAMTVKKNSPFRLARAVISAMLAISLATPTVAAPKQSGPNLIRDAEIEGLLRQFVRPILKAAHINDSSVTVYIIADDSINAFVAGGQRIFVHTGLFTKTKSPNEIIGVLAHETGHIAGGHLSRLNNEMATANAERIIGMLAGVAAMVGGAATGNDTAARAGQGVMIGSQVAAQRGFLSYQRSMESAADQAALKYLQATGQSPRGMLSLFGVLANESLAATSGADPYLFSHPMPFDRIHSLEVEAKKSPNFDKGDNPGLVLRYQLAKAKLTGFMQSTQRVYQRYPSTDKSLPARYARSIALFRHGDIANALPIIDGLIETVPQNPYFWELKAQALAENGQAERGLPAIEQARKLLPNSGLLQLLHAQILIGTEKPANADKALTLLTLAKKTEGDTPDLFKQMAAAYAIKGDVPRAELATAEYAFMIGDKEMALKKAKRAQDAFKHGSKEWLRANDLLTFASRK
jgi:predicted Zn-dependent protease